MHIELLKYKRITAVVFWITLALYILLKIFFNDTSDLLLDFLTIVFLLAMVILNLIRSMESYRSDRLFYRKPLWLSTIYFVGSVLIFAFFFEIVEVIPKIIRTNLYISVVILIGTYFISRMQIQK